MEFKLDPDEYDREGLYLVLGDGTRIVFTKESIEETTEKFWNDPNRISDQIKESPDFKRCSICPIKGDPDLCNALRPILPHLDIVDRYVSYDEVVAVYRGERADTLHVSHTTMQKALRYVSALSLMYYCKTGRKYWKYFLGVIPLMSAKEVATRIYLNIFWTLRGDKEMIAQTLAGLKEELTDVCKHQVKRMNLICQNDAFMNAFVSMHVSNDFLSGNMERMLEKSFEKFDQAGGMTGDLICFVD